MSLCLFDILLMFTFQGLNFTVGKKCVISMFEMLSFEKIYKEFSFQSSEVIDDSVELVIVKGINNEFLNILR